MDADVAQSVRMSHAGDSNVTLRQKPLKVPTERNSTHAKPSEALAEPEPHNTISRGNLIYSLRNIRGTKKSLEANIDSHLNGSAARRSVSFVSKPSSVSDKFVRQCEVCSYFTMCDMNFLLKCKPFRTMLVCVEVLQVIPSDMRTAFVWCQDCLDMSSTIRNQFLCDNPTNQRNV